MAYFDSITYESKLISFDHLEPFNFMFFSKKANKNLRVRVIFSNHCFTKKALGDEEESADILFVEGFNRSRIFCPVRYELSKKLVTLINDLNKDSIKVSQTNARRNWVYSITIEDSGINYHLFFKITKSPKDRRRMQDLEMVIESAYPQDMTKSEPNVLGRIGFHLLCSKIYLNEPAATKR